MASAPALRAASPDHQIDSPLPVQVRQTAIHFAFALLLLLTQQLGVVHAVRHIGQDRAAASVDDKKLPSEAHCEQCLAYAAIGSALTAAPSPLFVDLRATQLTIPVSTRERLPAAHYAFRSRAPPSAA